MNYSWRPSQYRTGREYQIDVISQRVLETWMAEASELPVSELWMLLSQPCLTRMPRGRSLEVAAFEPWVVSQQPNRARQIRNKSNTADHAGIEEKPRWSSSHGFPQVLALFFWRCFGEKPQPPILPIYLWNWNFMNDIDLYDDNSGTPPCPRLCLSLQYKYRGHSINTPQWYRMRPSSNRFRSGQAFSRTEYSAQKPRRNVTGTGDSGRIA